MKMLETIRSDRGSVRAAVYARFSSDRQREESIEAQIRAIEAYAERENISIVKTYVDRAKSATTDRRPEFLRMIADSKQKGFDFVLVHKLDRFARSRADSMIYRMELKRSGVSLLSVLVPMDGSPESVILESVLEAIAEYQSLNLGREVMKGLRENALKAEFTGGIPPLGYKINRETKKYEIVEYEAQAVKLIFEMVLDGVGYNTIIHELNRLGYKTRLGKSFGKNSIHGILRNERYTGTFVYNERAAKGMNGKTNIVKQKEKRMKGISQSD